MALTPEQQKELNALRKQEEQIVIRIGQALASSMPNQKEVVRLTQQKNILAQQQNKLLKITERNLNAVATAANEITDAADESAGLFLGLSKSTKELGKASQHHTQLVDSTAGGYS